MYEAEETFIQEMAMCCIIGGLIRGPCPPPTSYCPPHFPSSPSLLNVIDFENETDQTAHIRKRLYDLPSVRNTRSQIARLPPVTPPTHTHTHDLCPRPSANKSDNCTACVAGKVLLYIHRGNCCFHNPKTHLIFTLCHFEYV